MMGLSWSSEGSVACSALWMAVALSLCGVACTGGDETALAIADERTVLGLDVPSSEEAIIPGRFIVAPAAELEMQALETMDLDGQVDAEAMMAALLGEVAADAGVRLAQAFSQLNIMVVEGGFDDMVALCSQADTYCEPDHIISLDREEIEGADVQAVQPQAPWGLDRIDGVRDGSYRYDGTGRGVTVYVVDTGINTTHDDFAGRIAPGISTLSGRAVRDDVEDCQGHGTHVAGTAVGTTYGVAKEATVVPVRVLDCRGQGALSQVVAGVNWVAAQGQRPAVINMSLGGGASTFVDRAARDAIAAGYVTVVAAGNSNVNAEGSSPARLREALTVGATGRSDERASFSNFGAALDLFAPGVGIPSAYIGSTRAARALSGTSMASPHVAGAAALYLADEPSAAPDAVGAALIDAAAQNLVRDPRGSANLLLQLATTEALPAEPSPTNPEVDPNPSTTTPPGPAPVEPGPVAPAPGTPTRPAFCNRVPDVYKPIFRDICGF